MQDLLILHRNSVYNVVHLPTSIFLKIDKIQDQSVSTTYSTACLFSHQQLAFSKACLLAIIVKISYQIAWPMTSSCSTTLAIYQVFVTPKLASLHSRLLQKLPEITQKEFKKRCYTGVCRNKVEGSLGRESSSYSGCYFMLTLVVPLSEIWCTM